MNITINGKSAILKKGTSFEIVFENRSFTASDGYSLTITFPLRGCPENIAIFGNINRIDVVKSNITFDCEIRSGNFYRLGSITIIEINDIEVKAQFLEGRSEQNFDKTFDDIYINELDLGEYPHSQKPADPSTLWRGLDYNQEEVALPWVNNTSGNIQNEVVYDNGAYSYHEDCDGLSFQPYLIVIVKRICFALGYDCDISQWDSRGDLRYLLICNVLPYDWDVPQFARALPHWSVTDFFEKLEQFLGGEFDIDHRTKFINFAFTSNIIASAAFTRLENVIDSFSVSVTDEDESNYIELANRRYKECNHNMWKFYSCPWFIKDCKNDIIEYDTIEELITENKSLSVIQRFYRDSNQQKVLYAKDIDTYFILRCIRKEEVETRPSGIVVYNYFFILQPINVFGDRVVDADSDNDIELDFVPAWIDETEASKGNCLFFDIEGYDELTSDASRPDDSTTTIRGENDTLYQPIPLQRLLKGEETEISEYFDKIYLAFWDGSNNNVGKLPCPTIDIVTIRDDWSYIMSNYSMRFSKRGKANPCYNINPKQKYQFSFISNEIPNARSLFYINGKKYLCEKITATFSENGMSQLLKGNFYQVID